MKFSWKYIALLFLLLTFLNGSTAQPTSYSFENVDSLQQVAPRPVVVFIHTSWCRFCAAMKTETFGDEAVVELLNEHFYFVDFDTESKSPVDFGGRIYHYKPTGTNTGVHELAEALGSINGKLAYPALRIMTPNDEIIYQHNSFMNRDELMTVLEMVLQKD